jgi:hypothetical protein
VKLSFLREKTKPSSKYEVRCEAFIFQRKNVKIAKPSPKYEAKVISLHQNMKPKKPSSKYEVCCEAFVLQTKNETFVKIRRLV